MKRLLLVMLMGCSSAPSPKPAFYGFELEQCNKLATTCEESIACENKVRARYNRPLRDPKGGCQ
jgi:hypothetical protein